MLPAGVGLSRRCARGGGIKVQVRHSSLFGPDHLKLSDAALAEQLARLNPARAVPRLKRPSVQVFQSNVRQKNRPVVMMEMIQQWAGLVRWTDPQYFKQKFGQAQIPIEVGSF